LWKANSGKPCGKPVPEAVREKRAAAPGAQSYQNAAYAIKPKRPRKQQQQKQQQQQQRQQEQQHPSCKSSTQLAEEI